MVAAATRHAGICGGGSGSGGDGNIGAYSLRYGHGSKGDFEILAKYKNPCQAHF